MSQGGVSSLLRLRDRYTLLTENCEVASGRNCPNSDSRSSWFWNSLETCREHRMKLHLHLTYMYGLPEAITMGEQGGGGGGKRPPCPPLNEALILSSNFPQSIMMVYACATHLRIDLRLAERGGGRSAALLDDALLLLVGVEDLEEGLVDVRVLLEAVLRGKEKGGVRINYRDFSTALALFLTFCCTRHGSLFFYMIQKNTGQCRAFSAQFKKKVHVFISRNKKMVVSGISYSILLSLLHI